MRSDKFLFVNLSTQIFTLYFFEGMSAAYLLYFDLL